MVDFSVHLGLPCRFRRFVRFTGSDSEGKKPLVLGDLLHRVSFRAQAESPKNTEDRSDICGQDSQRSARDFEARSSLQPRHLPTKLWLANDF